VSEKNNGYSIDDFRARLSGLGGARYWRSLEELAQSEQFQTVLENEFPSAAALLSDGVNRRDFLRLLAASLALAGLGACSRRPREQIVPYVNAPEEITSGKPLYYATAFPFAGYGIGILVESYEGRPIKIEGNPQHPASLGATNPFAQAAILDLYDPERSQVVRRSRAISTWDDFVTAARARLDFQRSKRGAGLRLLSGRVTSPSLGQQIRALLEQFPEARWYTYEAVGRENIREGVRAVLGQEGNVVYRFDHARLILSLDSDFLYADPGSLRYTREFTNGRRARGKEPDMNRLYVVEPTPSITGAMADHRLALPASDIITLTRAVARRLGIKEGVGEDAPAVGRYAAWIDALVADLQAHRGSCVVLAGEPQPPQVHVLAHMMNELLGNLGSTILYTEPVEERTPKDGALSDLAREMGQGAVDALFIVDGNPVFDAPADLRFGEVLAQVPFRVHLGGHENETSALCHWHVPQAHFLESWGDIRSFDGTVTIMQPLIAPLYGGKSAHELIAVLSGNPASTPHQIVREFWRARFRETDFEAWWQRALHDGVVAGTSFPEKTAKAVSGFKFQVSSTPPLKPETRNQKPETADSFELVFRPDPTIWDGRFANNGWLQELPKPLTKLSWDNAALISPRTADRLDVRNGDGIELHLNGNRVMAPVWINPGQADESVTVSIGYGRTHGGKVGKGTGFNAYPLRTSSHFWFGRGLEIKKTDRRFDLVTTQGHHTMAGRPLVLNATLEQFRRQPDFVQQLRRTPAPGVTLYPAHKYDGNAWAMVIDTNVCIGCSACVVACQAENNIPVVGKDQVSRGRDMLWLRVDRYYQGPAEDPEIVYQPVPCMHCENAPCEPVCPVAATVHSSEGLNDMVYNRCVGTRYCSNNCPYKVRRFNFYQYADFETPSTRLRYNPDVTVRSRGVMEKCTYCVQRINHARIEAKKENRQVRDGEVMTACQQACPAEAIVFGNLSDSQSAVAKLKREPLNYGLLEELNTRPRTTYLARLKNPNPRIGETKK
jgi:molybdopterin-containing oxidoreductase family iron-sulfur binding subunit